MFKTTSFLRVLAIVLALAPMIGPASLQAFPKGLVRSSDFSQIYWVDRFGVSHNVSDTGMIPVYFKNDRIKEIAWEDWMRIPKGGPITAATPPEFYDTSMTRINLQGTGVPDPYNATTITSYKTVVSDPLVETQTVTTRAPVHITSKVLRHYQTSPTGQLQVTNGSAILDVQEQQPGTSTTVVRSTETMSPVENRTNETTTRQTVTRRQVEVMTPEVTQIGTAHMPLTARLDRRTTTTVTTPANNQRTVTTYSADTPLAILNGGGDSTRTETRTETRSDDEMSTTETVERMP